MSGELNWLHGGFTGGHDLANLFLTSHKRESATSTIFIICRHVSVILDEECGTWTCLTLSCFCASSSLFLCQAYLPFRPTCCSVSAASSSGPFLISTECYLNLSYSTSHHTMNYNYLCMYFISSSRIGPLILRVMPASSCILCLAQSPG